MQHLIDAAVDLPAEFLVTVEKFRNGARENVADQRARRLCRDEAAPPLNALSYFRAIEEVRR